MSEQYHNNPLHGLKLETLLTELVDHYGWEILAAATNFNCFKLNPSIKGSLKFLKKTEWARQKLEGIYMYKYKHLPRPDKTQFELPPRDRIVPDGVKPRDPVVLTLEGLARAQELKEKAAKERNPHGSRGPSAKPKGSYGKRSDRNREGYESRNKGPDRERESSRDSSPYSAPSRPAQSSSSSSSPSSASRASKPSEGSFDPWGDAKKKFEENKKED
jgi:uncharacterized protein (DUF2132 family)